MMLYTKKDLLIHLLIINCQYMQTVVNDDLVKQTIEEFRQWCPYTNLCYSNASSGLESTNFEHTQYACCLSCRCDTDCRYDCCPDSPSRYRSADEIKRVKESLEECVYAQFRDYDETKMNGYAYKMIGRCPKSFKNTTARKNCERSYQEFDFNEKVRNLPPATSLITKVTYRNSHCALCNGELATSLQVWNAKIQCYGDDFFFIQSLVDIHSKLPKQCQILFAVPVADSGLETERCERTIDTCNVTGKWLEYSHELESKCMSYTSIYQQYKNVHCFLCNGHDISDIKDVCNRTMQDSGLLPSFMALLDFSYHEETHLGRQKDVHPSCANGERFDSYLVRCRQLTCPAGLTLAEDKCVPLYTTILPSINAKVVFSVSYTLTPTDIARLFSSQKMIKFAFSINIDAFMRYDFVQSVSYKQICAMDIFIKFNNSLENTVISMMNTSNREISPFVKYIGVNVYFTAWGIVNVTRTVEELALLFTSSQYFGHFHVEYKTDESYVPFDGEAISPNLLSELAGEVDGLLYAMFNASVDDPTDGLGVLFLIPNFPDVCDTHISIQPMPFCPRIRLRSDEFDVDVSSKTAVMRNQHINTDAQFEKITFRDMLTDNNGTVFVCSDEYFMYISSMKSPSVVLTEKNAMWNELIVLSLLCLSVSLVSCLITLVVYCLCPQLRTVPGLNNMALVVSLFIAHALTFINSITHFSIHWLCSTIGVILHSALLSNFFWMFICSYHMMRMFLSFKDRSYPTQSWKKFLKYCLIVESLACFIVLSTIVVNVVLKEEDGIGYGGTLCYITDRYHILYFIAIPLALVLIANFFMFVFVIFRVSGTANMAHSSSNYNRNNFVIFIKLSTITGLSWIFAFLYQFTEVLIFAYANIIFNAGQGLFIMLSFVFNRRVFEMVRTLKSSRAARNTTDSSNYPHRSTRPVTASINGNSACLNSSKF